MPIYRGDGGSGDSSTDAYASQIAQYAQTATTKANEASASATAASGSASDANDSAVDALAAKVAAETAQGFAEAAQAAAEAAYDDFDDRYLGAKASDPSVDNDGNPLLTGALYFNSTASQMKVYSGSVWQILSGQGTVTSVAGTGTVNGITLTGTVTESGSLTLGGTLSGISSSQLASQNVSQFTNDSAYLTTVAFADVTSKPTTLSGYGITDAATSAQGTLADSALQTGDNVSTLVNDSGYITSYTETDTLDSVTNRGATTTNAITVGNLTSTGIDDNATSTAITIDASENVGIGTDSPSAVGTKTTVEVQGADGGAIRIGTPASNMFIDHDGVAGTRIRANAADMFIGATSGEMVFGTGSGATERMRIDASGNVGLGVTSALTAKLCLENNDSIAFQDTVGNNRAILSYDTSNDIIYGPAGAGINNHIWKKNGSELMRINTAGNVGIGTSSPLSLGAGYSSLDVRNSTGGGLVFGVDGGTQHGYLYSDSDGLTLEAFGARSLEFKTNAQEHMRIKSNGNVGIGTTSPNGPLHVREASSGVTSFSSSAWQIIAEDNSNAGVTVATPNTSKGSVFFADPQSSSAGYVQYDHSTDRMAFGTVNVERMRISSNGNVGIGIAPSDANQSYVSGAYTEAIIKGNSANKIGSLQIRSAGTVNATHFELAASDGLAASYLWNGTASAMVFGTSNSERMRIDSSGNVRINRTSNISSNAEKLGVQASNTTVLALYKPGTGSQNIAEYYSDTGGYGLKSTIKADGGAFFNGRVGINNQSPTYTLDVTNNSSAYAPSARFLSNGDAANWARVDIENVNAGVPFILYQDNGGAVGVRNEANQPMFFSTNAQTRMTIGASGYVGIGQSNPQVKLQVKTATATNETAIRLSDDVTQTLNVIVDGTATTGGIHYQNPNVGYQRWSTSGIERMRIDSSGNVGIGTSTISGGPASTLHVHSSVAGGPVPFGSESRVTISTNDLAAGNNGFLGSLFFGGQDVSSEQTAFTGAGVVGYAAGDLAEGNITADLLFYTQFGSNAPTEKMRITSSGNLLVGNTSATQGSKLEAVSNALAPAFLARVNAASDEAQWAMQVQKTTATTTTSQRFVRFLVNNGATASGYITANGANAATFTSTSDARLKENIEGISPQLENILSLKPCEFDFKDGSGRQTGFIAQEMRDVYPDVVGEDEDGYLSVAGWSKTEARLVKAIQEQQAMIEELKAEVAALKGA